MRKGGREGWRVKKGGEREGASEEWGGAEGGRAGGTEGRRDGEREGGMEGRREGGWVPGRSRVTS